ncbi:MAG: protein kinase [Candidatus Aminicenantes bacterium]|nr:protein kinase [Candidatus Aminicenantes bacterium]
MNAHLAGAAEKAIIIPEKLGAGRRGEVFRAEDSTLKRHVALKILPAQFSADPERLARFQREAQVLASLTHPNIAAIYGPEEADGKRFLVLELVSSAGSSGISAAAPSGP